jgi:KTSC domain
MRRDPVTSTNIAEIGYDQSSLTLEVLFRNGGIYQYFDIPKHEYESLLRAASIGEYLNRHIKGKYRYARV